jgi:hypothetical protein
MTMLRKHSIIAVANVDVSAMSPRRLTRHAPISYSHHRRMLTCQAQ